MRRAGEAGGGTARLLRRTLVLGALSMLGLPTIASPGRAGRARMAPARPLLLFEIDEGFSTSLLARHANDLPALDRRLTSIHRALAPLTRRYEVGVLIYPTFMYESQGRSTGGASPIERVRPALRHTLAFLRTRRAQGRVGVYLEAYSSGVATQQSGELARRPRPSLTGGPTDRGRPGLSMDLRALAALRAAYPDVLDGIRFHEVYGSDIVFRVSPTEAVRGFALDEQVVRGCVDLCRRTGMRLLWSDSCWLMKSPPTTGEPSYVYSARHRPYVEAEPYRSLQHYAEARLGERVCFAWANNNYHFTPNLEFIGAKIRASRPGVARPVPSWLLFDMPFRRFPLRGRPRARWGMSIQSWFWHELTNTVNGRYFPLGEMACPPEVLGAYVRKGLREGASVLQFEPSWYFFAEAPPYPWMPGPARPEGELAERPALRYLRNLLLAPDGPDAPPDRLDALFDRDQQRFHENDAASPPRMFASSTLAVLPRPPYGPRCAVACLQFLSTGPRWRRLNASRLPDYLFAGPLARARRIEVDGDGVDELLAVRNDGHASVLAAYGDRLADDHSLAASVDGARFAGLTTANLVPRAVGAGDPDEIVVARRRPDGAVSLRVYRRASGQAGAIGFTPLDDAESGATLDPFVSASALRAGAFAGIVGLRAAPLLHADGTRPPDRLAVLTRSAAGASASVRMDGRTVTTRLPGLPAGARGLAFTPLDADLDGADELCAVWQSAGNWVCRTWRLHGAAFVPAEGPKTLAPAAHGGQAIVALSLRSRILLNARRP